VGYTLRAAEYWWSYGHGATRKSLLVSDSKQSTRSIAAAKPSYFQRVGPGSSLFLFEGRQTVDAGDSVGFKSPYIGSKRIWRYLHCGDFRACPQMVLHPAIVGKKIDTCYLDTTYLNPQYCFPPQPLVIDACATLAKRSIFGQHVPHVTEAGGGKGILGAKPFEQHISGVAKKEETLADEEDVKPYLKGLEGLDTTERGRRLMNSWLVKEEDTKEDGDVVKTKKTGRTLIIMGYGTADLLR
jgi:DNA cross-link repair 1A protein